MALIFAGLDLETTGLSQEEGHRIIELALDLRREDGSRIGSYSTRLNPGRSIDPAAEAVHGIGLDMLIGEPAWEAVAPKVGALLGRCSYVVAHNGDGFDLPFLVRELMRVDVPVPEIRSIDTMLQGRWATPDGMPPNLRRLAFACGVDYDPERAHGALYDVEVMLACFFKQYPRGFFQLPTSTFELPPSKGKS